MNGKTFSSVVFELLTFHSVSCMHKCSCISILFNFSQLSQFSLSFVRLFSIAGTLTLFFIKNNLSGKLSRLAQLLWGLNTSCLVVCLLNSAMEQLTNILFNFADLSVYFSVNRAKGMLLSDDAAKYKTLRFCPLR